MSAPVDTADFTRTPPCSVEAEQVVLGCMMLSPDAVTEAEQIVQPSDFYRPANGTIFAAISDLASRHEPTDPVAVAERLGDNLTRVGGAPYLHTCYAAVPVAAQVGYYARIVAEKADLRRLLEVAAAIQNGVYTADATQSSNALTLIDDARNRLNKIEESQANADGEARPWSAILADVFDAIETAQENGGQVPGVPTGFADLDRMLNGLRPGQLVVIAARTSMGKSVAAVGMAQHAAWFCRLPVLVFSLEMFDTEVGMRLLSAGSRVPLDTVTSGQLSDDDWARVGKLAGETGDAPLYIDSSPNLTLADIRARARRMHRRHGLKLIVVDYLQLVETTASASRERDVAAVSRGLKLLAMDLGVPVVAVAQLNRGPEQRADKRPTKGDLRESGAIENDADVILFIHRDDYYDKESPRAGEADFIVGKNRNGPTDTVTVAAQLHLSRFVDMAIM